MKTLLFVLAIVFVSQIPNYQCITGKYEIQNEGYFSTIELKKDKSFKYEFRGISCWVWHDRIGKWITDENTLILIDSFEWKEESVIMKESVIGSMDKYIEIESINKDKDPIKNLQVKYDEIGGSEFWQKGNTDNNGIVRFSPIIARTYSEKDNARLEFTYTEHDKEVSTDIFPKLMSNKITIQINSIPKIEMRERIEKYKIIGNELIGMGGNSLDSGMKFRKEK